MNKQTTIKTPVRYDHTVESIYDANESFLFAIGDTDFEDDGLKALGQQIAAALNTTADQSRRIEDIMPARKALGHQRQLDESGVMVGVSRQAVDEVCAFIDALAKGENDED